MEKSHQASAYGYVVCLIAVVTSLFTINSLVRNAFDYASPAMSREVSMEFGASLEGCRQRYADRFARPRGPNEVASAMPPDSVMQKFCTEERQARIDSVRYNAMRSMVTSALLLLVAVGLFLVHWRWLRQARSAA